jgi:hypothetical protein
MRDFPGIETIRQIALGIAYFEYHGKVHSEFAIAGKSLILSSWTILPLKYRKSNQRS